MQRGVRGRTGDRAAAGARSQASSRDHGSVQLPAVTETTSNSALVTRPTNTVQVLMNSRQVMTYRCGENLSGLDHGVRSQIARTKRQKIIL